MSLSNPSRLTTTLYRSFWRATKRMQTLQTEVNVRTALLEQFPTAPAGLFESMKSQALPVDMLRAAFRYPLDETDSNSFSKRIDAAFSTLKIVNIALNSAKESTASAASEPGATSSKVAPSNAHVQIPHKPASVKYSIGQVIAHCKFGYRGVIVGWHPTCQASDEWKTRNGVVRPNQAYYSVAVDVRDRTDAQVSYVAQENIRLLSSTSDMEACDESTDGIPFYVNAVPMNVIDNTDFSGEGNGGVVISASTIASKKSLASALACSSAITQGHMEDIAALNRMVFHPLVTKYFSHFRPSEGVYIPTPHLAQLYPHDITSQVAATKAVPSLRVRLSVNKQRPNVNSSNCRDDAVAKTFGQKDNSRRPITGHS